MEADMWEYWKRDQKIKTIDIDETNYAKAKEKEEEEGRKWV